MTLKIRAIQTKSIPEIIIQELKKLVDKGELAPGDKLPNERELSKMLNVSRPSLREALMALNLLGILENKRGKGTFLKDSSLRWPTEPFFASSLKAENFLHMLEARQILEVEIAGFASERSSREDIIDLEKILENMRSNLDDPKKYIEYELQFHKAVTKAAKNSTIDSIMEKIYQQLQDARSYVQEYYSKNKLNIEPSKASQYKFYPWTPSSPASLEQDLLGHELIFKYIKENDSELAKKAMSDHMQVKYHFINTQEVNNNSLKRSSV